MPYSSASDLLLGDATIAPGFDTQKFVNDAADEIDSALGVLYVLPIDQSLLAQHSKLTLKRINNWLATGQIILAQAIGSEDMSLHAYGASLLRDARALLAEIANGGLEGAVLRSGATGSAGPRVINEDETSATAAFADYTMRRHLYPEVPFGPVWQPGA